MGLQILGHPLVAVVEGHFVLDRIGPDVDEPTGFAVLRPRHRAAVQVQDERRIAIETVQRLWREAIAATVVVPRLKRPMVVAEVEALHHGRDERGCQRGAVRTLVAHEHPRRLTVCLDVVDVEPQPFQADEVLDHQEDDTGEWHLARHSENDHFRFR
jgi:hypothetical protein